MKKLTKFDVGPIYLISYVLQLVLQTVVLTAFQARYGDAYKDHYSWTYAIVFVNGLSFLAAVLGYSAAKKIKFFSEVGIKKKPDAKMALLIVPIAVFTIFSTMPLANWFVELFGKLGYDVASSSITMPTDVVTTVVSCFANALAISSPSSLTSTLRFASIIMLVMMLLFLSVKIN